jgi:hypothetical protein
MMTIRLAREASARLTRMADEGAVPDAAIGGCIALGAMADEGAVMDTASGERIARVATADGVTVVTAMVAWTALGAVECVAAVVAAASGRIWAMANCTSAVADCT